jgi:hypothetical protein
MSAESGESVPYRFKVPFLEDGYLGAIFIQAMVVKKNKP